MKSNLATVSDQAALKRVVFLSVAWGFNTFAFSIVYPFLPIYLHKIRGIPMDKAGLVFPVMGLAAIISGPISGFLADRIGRRQLIIGGPLARSVAFIFLAFMAWLNAPFLAIIAGLFFAAMLGTFFQSGSNAYVTDLVAPEDRTVAFSTLRVGLNFGWMLGPAVGSFLARTPFSLLFTITGVLCWATAFIPFRFCPVVPHVKNVNKIGMPRLKTVRAILTHDPLFSLVLGLTLLMFMSVSQYVSTLSIFSTDVVGIKLTWLGFLFTINGAIVIVFLIPINKLLKYANPALRISIGAFLYICALTGFGLSPHWGARTVQVLGYAISAAWLHLAGCIVLLTGAEMLSITAVLAIVGHMAPPDKIGRYMGMYGLTMGVSWSLGPYIGSLLFEPLRYHPLMLWLILSSGAAFACVGFLLLTVLRVPLARLKQES